MNYKEKIREIIKIIEENHIDMYFNITKEELDNYINEIFNTYEIKDDYDFYYYTNVIIKRIFGIFDSHTKMLLDDKNYLPLRFKYIDEELYVTRTIKENEDILFGKVKKINGIDIVDIVKEIEKTIAYSTKEYLKSSIEKFLIYDYKIRSLPSIDNKCEYFDFEILKDDKLINKRISTFNEKLDIGVNYIDNYQFKQIDDIIYLVYNLNKEEYPNQMKEFVLKIKEFSLEHNIFKFIVDIRGNTGGNSEIINPLLDFLKGKKVITLVDKYVFSAGRFDIFHLKNINSIFIGTGIGTSLNCFGNAPSFKYEQYIIPICNKYFYMDTTYKYENFKYADTKNKFKKLKENKELFIPQIFEPDYYIENSIEDYKNGIDRELEYAIEILNNTKLKY